jgi:hypothetical protein
LRLSTNAGATVFLLIIPIIEHITQPSGQSAFIY